MLLKAECLQHTGSFKVRGAGARLEALDPDERARGVVACSSGNHARAVAWVAERLGVRAVVCVPEWIDPVKLSAIRGHGAEAVLAGATYDEAADRADDLARERGLVPVHPFDDPVVAAGQGTVTLEVLERLPDVGTLVVPLSGGGLAGGIGFAVAARGRGVRVVAASAARARVMVESLGAGRPVELPEEETLASALSGGIGLRNRHTLRLVRDHVHEHVLVEEASVAAAMAYAYRELRLVVEGGGAVGLAALLDDAVAAGDGRPVVVVVSGGNVSPAVLRRVLGARDGRRDPADPVGAAPPERPAPGTAGGGA